MHLKFKFQKQMNVCIRIQSTLRIFLESPSTLALEQMFTHILAYNLHITLKKIHLFLWAPPPHVTWNDAKGKTIADADLKCSFRYILSYNTRKMCLNLAWGFILRHYLMGPMNMILI